MNRHSHAARERPSDWAEDVLRDRRLVGRAIAAQFHRRAPEAPPDLLLAATAEQGEHGDPEQHGAARGQ